MGCFVSTNKTPQSSKFHQHSSKSNRTPPPPVVDVETVKEVLMENDPKKIRHQDPNNILEDPNNISEIETTMSECLSTATLDDEIDAFRRKIVDRSPSKSRIRRNLSGELPPPPTRKSPARSKEMSPGRVKMVPERNNNNNRGNGFGSAGRVRPGSGNVSAARSRSPANRTVAGGGDSGGRNEIGRSLSCRRTGKSPGRVVSDLNERIRKPGSGRVREEGNWGPNVTSNDELLENPLVSLECFIFL